MSPYCTLHSIPAIFHAIPFNTHSTVAYIPHTFCSSIAKRKPKYTTCDGDTIQLSEPVIIPTLNEQHTHRRSRIAFEIFPTERFVPVLRKFSSS